MKVFYRKNNSKKLLNGVAYNLTKLRNDGTNNKIVEGTLEISESYGSFKAINFVDYFGKELPKTNILGNTQPPGRRYGTEYVSVKEGDIIVCQADTFKTLAKNGRYVIEEVMLKETTSSSGYVRRENYIRFVGIPRKYRYYGGWRFRKLNQEESREIQLAGILENKDPEFIKTSKIRKIDLVENKERELMVVLSKSILDRHRHAISILDWGIRMHGDKLRTKKEDFEPLLDMKLKDILKLIDIV